MFLSFSEARIPNFCSLSLFASAYFFVSTSKGCEKVMSAPTFVSNNKIFWGQDRIEFALNEAKK